MHNALEVKVRTSRLKLSPASTDMLASADSYDWILFTSKNAVEYFMNELNERKLHTPKNPKVAAVGPVTAEALRRYKIAVDALPTKATVKDMLRSLGPMKGKKLLFPRSAISPVDIIRDLRKQGVSVSVIPLYTTEVVPLSKKEWKILRAGKYASIMFKSPSGVTGFLEQLTVQERKMTLTVPAECIGPTTAKAARAAGFRQVKDLSI